MKNLYEYVDNAVTSNKLTDLKPEVKEVLDNEVASIIDVFKKYTSDVESREARVNIKVDGSFNFNGEADSEEAMDQKEEAFNNIVSDLKSLGYKDFGGTAGFDRSLIPFNNAVGNAFFSLTKRCEGMRINVRFMAWSRGKNYEADIKVKF